MKETVKLKKRSMRRTENKIALCFVLIPLFGYLVFNIFPIAISFVIQFCDMDFYDLNTLSWNNFANFRYVFNDALFWKSLGNTLFFATAQFVSLAIAFAIAVLLNNIKRGSVLLKILFFMPYICSSAAVAIIFRWLFDDAFGIVNSVLVKLFGSQAHVNWLTDETSFPWVIYLATLWQAPGYGIVMYTAALTSLNPSLFEAAEIDGAGAFVKFRKITFPSVAPTTFFLLMAGIIAGLQSFELPYILAGVTWEGYVGPNNSGLTTAIYIYNNAVNFNQMARASAASWILFAIVFVISVINFKLRKRWVDE